jgi:cell wall-associated NlpC family hydrolase
VTTPETPHSEPRRALRAYRLLLSGLLLAAAAPAFAAPMLSSDSADMQRISSTSQALVGADLLSERAMLSAADVNMLIDSGDALATGDSAAQGRVQTLLKRAMTLLGTPYRWGGNSPDSGFDCSGLVGYVFRTALGIELPRVSREMAGNGEQVERGALAAGDLVFFGRRGKRVDHVGIYMGNGRFVHAPRTGRDVTVSSLDEGYWAGRFLQARRVEGLNG